MYTEGAAADLLRVAPSTLHWWLEGRAPRYRPVIRVEPTGSRVVTWAEFVEAGLLRSCRRDHDVPLRELRDFIDRMGDEFQVPYPLTVGRMSGPGRRLMIDLQGRSELDPEFCLVAMANGQAVLTVPGEEFSSGWSGRATSQPRGARTMILRRRRGSTRSSDSAGLRSAASPPRPSPGSLTPAHLPRRSPRTSAWIWRRCGGRTAMSWRVTRQRDPQGGPGPHLR